ncbi:uncharacterized protein MONBRDRAFT_23227 [Monosiga brevicollis MX1]|uniref:Uncharacterized protein n=1 Tax=Monosiga brevicollis TaxID=81824 RepID=A9URJ7_MONBE|nr:uncharacterized protein MONBRDRAFT_23227 [Monosiga brevicollis MX1]EDQ91935.1 predicted protein [Monosiga brevicollis MX1]|eukprot:XP_001743221.1 hypothetical protein [Monosiga brevicollis MX1]
MEAKGERRRAPPSALREYFASLGEPQAAVLDQLEAVQRSFPQPEWSSMTENQRDRALSKPFLLSDLTILVYNEADFGRVVHELRSNAIAKQHHLRWQQDIEARKLAVKQAQKRSWFRPAARRSSAASPRPSFAPQPTSTAQAEVPVPPADNSDHADLTQMAQQSEEYVEVIGHGPSPANPNLEEDSEDEPSDVMATSAYNSADGSYAAAALEVLARRRARACDSVASIGPPVAATAAAAATAQDDYDSDALPSDSEDPAEPARNPHKTERGRRMTAFIRPKAPPVLPRTKPVASVTTPPIEAASPTPHSPSSAKKVPRRRKAPVPPPQQSKDVDVKHSSAVAAWAADPDLPLPPPPAELLLLSDSLGSDTINAEPLPPPPPALDLMSGKAALQSSLIEPSGPITHREGQRMTTRFSAGDLLGQSTDNSSPDNNPASAKQSKRSSGIHVAHL